MSGFKLAAIVLIVVGVFVATGVFYNVVEIHGTTSFAAVSGDFDSIQVSATSLTGGGFDKEETSIGLVSFDCDEVNKTFEDNISWKYAWSIKVYCFINGTFETINFEMIWNSTVTVQIHSSGVFLSLAREVPIQYMLDISLAERLTVSALIVFVFSIPALFIALDYVTDRYFDHDCEGFI